MEMSREEMCSMLCNMGYSREELEVCSDRELMSMCGGNQNYDVMENHATQNYMFFSNLKTIKRLVDQMLDMDESAIDSTLQNGHGWAVDHIGTSKDDVEEVYNFLMDRDSSRKVGKEEREESFVHEKIKTWKKFCE